ncbi:MAG: hypothetical protein ACREYE_11650, partial [Gammaproteobacteria bacterium]
AGQIAVLSRTVLARILRLDRRTGISAKADLTAPPQTCRKDTNYEQAVPISEHPLHRVLGVPGVVQVEKMVTQFVSWKKHSGGQQRSIIVGFDVTAGILHPGM